MKLWWVTCSQDHHSEFAVRDPQGDSEVRRQAESQSEWRVEAPLLFPSAIKGQWVRPGEVTQPSHSHPAGF